jgi:hypothetical protein
MKWIKVGFFLGALTLVLLVVGAGKIDREELKRILAVKEREDPVTSNLH